MRSLIITLYPRTTAVVPRSYNALVQAALYAGWRDSNPLFHDEGFANNAKVFRLFTFSQLEGKSFVDKEKKTVSFNDIVRLEVRMPMEELLDNLAESLAQRGEMRIGKSVFSIVNLSAADRLLFPQRALIRMRMPVTLHRTREDGYTDYLHPSSVEFIEDMQKNTVAKKAAFGLSSGLAQLIPLEETLKKRVVQFKGTNVNGWTGDFIMSADAETFSFLYCTGLGARNSQGFGMFDIVDKPLI